MTSDTCDVLVVGLGPVGAVLAGLLRLHGLSVIAIDRETDIYPLPRAGAFDDEAMRTFQMLGLADTLLPLCRVMSGYQFLSASGETLMRFDIPEDIGPNGWAPTYILHQPSIERVLRDRLIALGVDVRVTTKLTAFTQNDDAVAAQVETLSGAGTITAKYLIGSDGANSPVREAIGGGAFDYDFSESWLVIDAIVDDPTELPDIATQVLDPLQPTTFMRMTGDRYRWEFMLKPGDDAATFTSDETLARLLAPWNADGRIEVERRALYRFRGLVADRWRDRRVLIAGDAAHQMPPFAGQGMCSGFRDAVNLAWKLAEVLRGTADDALLDTYQREREPHVRGLIERSIQFGKMICILDPAIAAQRDAGMRAMRDAGQTPPMLPQLPLQGGCLAGGAESGTLFVQPVVGDVRLDDRLGIGAALITLTPATQPPGEVRQFHITPGGHGPFVPLLVRWLEERGVDAVLIRPDRHVFGIGDPDRMLAAWQAKRAAESASLA